MVDTLVQAEAGAAPVAPESVTDDMLNAAIEETAPVAPVTEPVVEAPVVEAPVIETPAVEEVVAPAGELTPEQKEDHAEKSRLGRKIVNVEKQLGTILERLDALNQPARGGYAPAAPEASDQSGLFNPDDIVTTADDTIRIIKQYEQQKQQEQLKYRSNYVQTVVTSGTGELHEEVIEFMDKNEANYMPVTGDPKVDGVINYNRAKADYLSAKLTAASAPVKPKIGSGEPPVAPTGVSAAGKVAPSKPTLPTLDPIAADFMRRTGMTEEQVMEALSGDAPVTLGGRR